MKVDFHKEHLKLSFKAFSELFKHLPKHIVEDAWSKANKKPIKAVKK